MFRPPGALGLHFERDIQLGTVTISLLLILPPFSKKQRVREYWQRQTGVVFLILLSPLGIHGPKVSGRDACISHSIPGAS